MSSDRFVEESERDALYQIFKVKGEDKLAGFLRHKGKSEERIRELLGQMIGSKVWDEFSEYERQSSALDTDGVETTGRIDEHPATSNLALRAHDVPVTKDEDVYPIRREGKKGLVLILTNLFRGVKSEKGQNLERLGAQKDSENMRELWETVGCDVIGPKYDCTADQMLQELEDVQNVEKGKYDFVVVILSTHGGLVRNGNVCLYSEEKLVSSVGNEKWFEETRLEAMTINESSKSFVANPVDRNPSPNGSGTSSSRVEYIEGEHEMCYDVNMQSVRVSKILDMFNNATAKNLRGIPKMFMFQFCRGKTHDKGEVVEDGDPEKSDDEGKVQIVRIPTMSDILVAYPCHRGYAAWREVDKGSWFISKIHETFTEFWKSEHVVDMLTRVNGKMKKAHGTYRKESTGEDLYDVKSMSKFESSLTKKFYLYAKRK